MTTTAVIGAGHNGLVAAVVLARAGHDVTVLEAGPEVGGCIWTETLPSGHRLERGAVEHAGLVPLARELGLARFGLRFVPGDHLAAAAVGDDVLAMPVDVEAMADTLGSDGPAYRRFAELAGRLFALLDDLSAPPTLAELAAGLSGVTGGDELLRTLVSSCEVVLERWFTNATLRTSLAMYAAHGQMPPWAPGTGMFSLLLPAGHGAPTARPVGGSAAVVDALVAALDAAGGRVRVEAAVRRLAARVGGGATVRYGDGEQLDVDTVVSTIDLPRTVALLDDPPAAMTTAARQVGSGRFNVSELKIDLALRAPSELGALTVAPSALWLLQQHDGSLHRAFGDIVAGRLPDDLPVMCTLPSVADPSAAPADGAVAWLSAFVPLRPRNGWTAELESEAVARALTTVQRTTGVDLTAHLMATRVGGPATWSARLRSADGNPNHLDLSLDQLLAWRPPGMARHTTPLPWLYLSGAGTHPGGGLSGRAGRQAAIAVLGRRPTDAPRRSELASLLAGWRFYRSMRAEVHRA